jgi:HEAT repeat protein
MKHSLIIHNFRVNANHFLTEKRKKILIEPKTNFRYNTDIELFSAVEGKNPVSTVKKMVAYHISRLQDKSADVRMKAVKELELIGDPDALDPLRALYSSDPDMDVRKAAQEAGRTIFLKNQSPQK